MSAEGRQILIVDDEDLLRELVAEVLTDAGYGVREARDGSVAISTLAEQGAPDLMLLDLHMAGIDGWGVLEEAAALPRPPRVLIMTGRGEISAPGRLAPYVTGHLHKPFPPDELLRACARALERPAAQAVAGDRRREHRCPYLGPPALLAQGAEREPVQLLQLSAHGFRVELPRTTAPGDRLTIEVPIPGHARPLRLVGTVRWRRETLVGAELADVDSQDVTLLHGLIAG